MWKLNKMKWIEKERNLGMYRYVNLITLLLLIALFPSLAAQSPENTLRLPELIREALDNNPDLQSAQNAWQAENAKIPQAGALPDPVISFNLMK